MIIHERTARFVVVNAEPFTIAVECAGDVLARVGAVLLMEEFLADRENAQHMPTRLVSLEDGEYDSDGVDLLLNFIHAARSVWANMTDVEAVKATRLPIPNLDHLAFIVDIRTQAHNIRTQALDSGLPVNTASRVANLDSNAAAPLHGSSQRGEQQHCFVQATCGGVREDSVAEDKGRVTATSVSQLDKAQRSIPAWAAGVSVDEQPGVDPTRCSDISDVADDGAENEDIDMCGRDDSVEDSDEDEDEDEDEAEDEDEERVPIETGDLLRLIREAGVLCAPVSEAQMDSIVQAITVV